jgi:hypothetical protein
MIPIIIVSFFVLVAFILFVVFIVKIIIRSAKSEKAPKSLVLKAIISGVTWAILGIVNVVLIVIVLFNGDPLIDKIFNAGADAASKAIVYTFENVEKNWNKDTLNKANMIDFTIMSTKKTEEKDKEKYEIRLLIENKLGRDKPISYWDLTTQNLLFGLDNNDVFYASRITESSSDLIPTGKSYVTISVEVPKFATLKQIGLGENKKPVGE